MAKYSVDESSLVQLGDAIRAKTGGTDALEFPAGMVEAVAGISVSAEYTILENTPVTLDFSNGEEYQRVVVPDGYLVKSAVIAKPAALVPENLPVGVEIAGVAGTREENTGTLPADVHQVTFMDGDQVLWVRSVADGDDCADPVTRGFIETPARESTAQYDYTFKGWSLTDGGSTSSTALSAVTADKTVYAAYTSAVRYYTITYYDEDGVTVLQTESLAYGATPGYTPVKSGYSLTGWEPAIASVTGPASYTAKWKEESIWVGAIDDDWDAIIAAAADGSYANKYKLGNYKILTLNGFDCYMQLVAMNADDLADGSGKAAMTFITMTVSATGGFTSYGYSDPWITGRLRTKYINEKYGNYMPENLTAAIKEVRKYSINYSSAAAYTEDETADKLWIPSEREFFGTGETQGVMYDHVINGDISKVKTSTFNDQYSSEAYWLRTRNGYNCRRVNANGGLGAGSDAWNGLALGFCL